MLPEEEEMTACHRQRSIWARPSLAPAMPDGGAVIRPDQHQHHPSSRNMLLMVCMLTDSGVPTLIFLRSRALSRLSYSN